MSELPQKADLPTWRELTRAPTVRSYLFRSWDEDPHLEAEGARAADRRSADAPTDRDGQAELPL
jgi:hypothetical protein